MRRTALCPFLLSMALLAASPLAFAQGPTSLAGKVGDCRDSVITMPAPPQAKPHPLAATAHKAQPAQVVRGGGGGGDDDNGAAPRVPHWHSFLPGMFR